MSSLLELNSLAVNGLLFFVLAVSVWSAGARLAYLADALSERYGLAKSTVGLVFLAVSTSLPEIGTTLTAAAKQNAPLVANNLFGGVVLQTAILAVADLWTRGAITNVPRRANHVLEATLLILLLAALETVLILSDPVSIFSVGLGSLFVGCAYMVSVFLLRRYNSMNDWVPVDPPATILPITDRAVSVYFLTSKGLVVQSLSACLIILVLGGMLVATAEILAEQTGFGASFTGVTLLAGATSLPELSTTISAVRMGAVSMAISNIFGSNLIMLVLVLPADVLYRSGPILQDVATSARLALALGIFVTCVYLVGLIVRRKPVIGGIGLDSMIVLLTYIASLGLFYVYR